MAGNTIKIVTINARGLHNTRKRISLFQWLNEAKIDIVLIQETYCTKGFSKQFSFQWDGDVYHSYTDSQHARGVCILLSKRFQGKVLNSCKDENGRRLLLDIIYRDKVYTVVNLYCPTNTNDRIKFLIDSTAWVKQNRYASDESLLIIGGDVNCVESSYDRVSNVIDKSSTYLGNMKNELNVTDVWRYMNPNKKEFTYIDPSYRNRNSRIDVLCVCKELEPYMELCEHVNNPCPDHKAVMISFRCNNRQRGRGYWKLNVSILSEEKYKDYIRKLIIDTISEYNNTNEVDKAMIWELVKIRVKEFTVRYSCARSKHKTNIIKEIESKLTILDREIEADSNNDELITNRKLLKEQLDALYLERSMGAHIRSRVKWVEEGERSTSYFLALEKFRQSTNNISVLKENNVTYTEDKDILRIAGKFYTELYTSKNPCDNEIDGYLDNINLPVLSQEKQLLCEDDINIEECKTAIHIMKHNKSPGEDGLPIEFYQTFWKELGFFLVEMYNECFINKILPLSIRKSVIALLHKKENKDNIANYRPISLTNTDYRILAFVLASRLQNVIADIVSPDQVAYIKKRYIGTNVRFVQDIFELYNKTNKSGIFMFVDFEKAFDSIEWPFLFKVLHKFKFGNNFMQWIKILYTEPCAFVKNNGHFSEEFTLSRGVRQGCPVSSLLFILCMEVLACHIRQNDRITGLSLDDNGSKCIKIIQYADDSTLLLNNTSEMKEAIKCLDIFGKVAGTKVNKSKCEGLWIGSNKHRQNGCTMHDIKWPTHPIRYLGIYIGHDTKECDKLNYDTKVAKIDDILKQSTKRNLTLFGKVCIIKSLALSKIIYIALGLTIPDKIIKEIDRLIFRFLWGKRDRIKRKSIINTLEKGGLNMVDVRSQLSAIKASWVGRIISAPSEHLWSYLPKQYLSKFGDDYYILKTTFDQKSMFPSLTVIPTFYQDMVIAYNKSKFIHYDRFRDNIKQQPIWGNKFIKFKNKTLFFRSWVAVGIVSIENLRLINGKLDVAYLFALIKDKRQLHTELNILQQALTSANVDISNEPSRIISIPVFIHQNGKEYEWRCNRSSYFYAHLIDNLRVNPTSETYWKGYGNYGITDDTVSSAYMQRIKLIKDMKLAETNFKILNNILPCNRNLYKWGKCESNVCYLCHEEESVSHLLYECKHVQPLWKVVSRGIFGAKHISHNMVIFGSDLDVALNYAFSIVIYYIYKEWLICSLERRQRRETFCSKAFSNYLAYRKNVYSKCKGYIWHKVCDILNDLIRVLDSSSDYIS